MSGPREQIKGWEVRHSPAEGIVEASRDGDWVVLTVGWGSQAGEVYMPAHTAGEVAQHLAALSQPA